MERTGLTIGPGFTNVHLLGVANKIHTDAREALETLALSSFDLDVSLGEERVLKSPKKRAAAFKMGTLRLDEGLSVELEELSVQDPVSPSPAERAQRTARPVTRSGERGNAVASGSGSRRR